MDDQAHPNLRHIPLDSAQWRLIESIFHAALELPLPERNAYIHRAAGSDAAVRAEVLRLIEADAAVGDAFDQPVALWAAPAPVPLLESGDLIAGRFQILRLVGEGGMGHVYEAFDQDLNVRVALKTIRPELLVYPNALQIFRREVRTARQITHRNVCRIYDLDRGTLASASPVPEIWFITMEFLDGETLAARLHRAGPLDPATALSVALQVAEALDCAHRAGIIHRDIKPGNIMLVSEKDSLRAVVMDFGLARPDPLLTVRNSAHSIAGLAGTLAYMAPEQLDPQGVVSAATDVYAFGLVLYEMMTGQQCFATRGLLHPPKQSASAVPLPSAIVPSWSLAIEGCLHLQPRQRFQSAAAVAAVLASSTRSTRLMLRLRRQLQRAVPVRFSLLVLALLVIVSLFFVVSRLTLQKSPPPVTPGALIYLAPVLNQTANSQLNDVTELVRASLNQSTQLTLLDAGREADTLQRMMHTASSPINAALAREIAMRNGAERIVFVTLSGSSGNYLLTVDLQRADNSPLRYRQHWSAQFSWKMSDSPTRNVSPELLAAIRNASAWVRDQVGESPAQIAQLDAPPDDVTTDNWAALAAYTKAEKLRTAHQFEQAVDAYNAALRVDPSFALAYARRGDVLMQLNRFADGYDSYRHALDLANQHRLDLRERDRIEGDSALDTWNNQGAKLAFRDSLLYYPNDYAAHCYLAYALYGLGEIDAAIAELRKAYALDPRRPAAVEHIALYFLLLGKTAEAQPWIERIAEVTDAEQQFYPRALAALQNGDLNLARQQLEKMAHASRATLRSNAAGLLTRLAVERGQLDEARRWTNSGLEVDRSLGNRALEARRLLDLAALDCLQQQWQSCTDLLKQAVARDRSPQLDLQASQLLGEAIDTAPPSARTQLGQLLGELVHAQPAVEQTVVEQVVRLRIEGEWRLSRGESARALKLFRQAAAIGPVTLDHAAEARAALAQARSSNTPLRTQFLQEARDACSADLVDGTAHFHWFFSDQPGLLTRQAHRLLAVEQQLRQHDATGQSAQRILSLFAAGAAPSTPGHVEARPQ